MTATIETYHPTDTAHLDIKPGIADVKQNLVGPDIKPNMVVADNNNTQSIEVALEVSEFLIFYHLFALLPGNLFRHCKLIHAVVEVTLSATWF